MNPTTFSQALEVLYSSLSTLDSDSLCNIRNCYINNRDLSRYIHMTIEKDNTSMDLVLSYDQFYKVPVLHFRVNGKVECSFEYAQLDIHPILQSPYAMLHPCETDAFMKTTHLEGLAYLVFWFNYQMSLLQTGVQLRV